MLFLHTGGTPAVFVNGRPLEVIAPGDEPLLWVLREQLGLTGTKYSCGIGLCGACTVHMNGAAIKSCGVLAGQADGAEVTTIEGIGTPDALHPMQAAFRECHALQCGFCTPGMIMRSIDLLNNNPNPTDDEIRWGISGNLCRCTGYNNIVKAVRQAADEVQKETV